MIKNWLILSFLQLNFFNNFRNSLRKFSWNDINVSFKYWILKNVSSNIIKDKSNLFRIWNLQQLNIRKCNKIKFQSKVLFSQINFFSFSGYLPWNFISNLNKLQLQYKRGFHLFIFLNCEFGAVPYQDFWIQRGGGAQNKIIVTPSGCGYKGESPGAGEILKFNT